MEPARPAGRACEQPVALGGGFERCNDGVVHRAEVGVCASELPRAAAFDDARLRALDRIVLENDWSPEELAEVLPCLADTDCVNAVHGYCELVRDDGLWSGGALTRCVYGCTVDARCGNQKVCLCGSPVGTCVSATCRNDDECPGALSCAQYTSELSCGQGLTLAFACQSDVDQCATDAECPGASCLYSGQQRYCGQAGVGCPVPGRPFLVGDAVRLAAPTQRDDWFSHDALTLEPVHSSLTGATELRAELARSWTEMALMEHASVASFARFALHLLSVGAPPELLVAATTAMQDETRHAQVCFALARRYGGEDVGPGELDLDDAFSVGDLESIVLAAVKEGCIGETIAALEASEAAEHCVDLPTRRLLERIAREEAVHAQLAWRFVAWALGRANASFIARVRSTFTNELAGPAGQEAPASLHDLTLLAFGVVTPAEREKLRQRALRETVLPCAEVLLSSPLSEPRAQSHPVRTGPAATSSLQTPCNPMLPTNNAGIAG